MTFRTSSFMKFLSPAIIAKTIPTFDRLTLAIVGLCWTSTIAIMIFAAHTVNLSVNAKNDAEAALATEPNLPRITSSGVGGKELMTMIEHLKEHYPDITFNWTNNVLSLTTANSGLYHQWLTAIGQIDTLYPQYHWSIKSMCIGKGCGTQALMQISLTGQNVSLEMPQPAQ